MKGWSRRKMAGSKVRYEEAAEEILGIKLRMERNDWFDVKAQEAIKSGNDARAKMLTRVTRESVTNYKEKREAANKFCRRKKREVEVQKLEQMQADFGEKKFRKFFKAMKKVKGYQPETGAVENNLGELLCNDPFYFSH